MKITSKTPIRLLTPVINVFLKVYGDRIKEHGASFVASEVLAEHLRGKGQKIPELVSPKERIRQGQKKRWRAERKSNREVEQKIEARRERKAAAEKARRKRIKAEAVKVEKIEVAGVAAE